MRQMDILTVGESLIDFVTVKGADPTKITLEGNAGGAPANVMAMATKLGDKTAFIGKVGRDYYGQYLRDYIQKAGVDVSAMVSGDEPTTLAMVSLDEKGNRSFSFYRSATADVMLDVADLDMALIEGCKIFHFGSVSMTTDPARTATLTAAKAAKAAGAKVSFDPNYRPLLWAGEEEATAAMREGLELANYVKVSDEEATMLTGEADPEKAALALQSKYGLDFVAVTLGPDGCVGISQAARLRLPTYDVPCVDTTGAGDAFWGTALHKLLEYMGQPIDEAKMKTLLEYGNAAGSLVTMKHGAILPQPTEKEILQCIKTQPLLVRG